ncbi:hypothetical protein [Oceanobacillus oncorhynchi]|uniref:hypothetical protein n=1 Tax=Oceanobacillus oncorhynchi TaxID=545501 RepID=UPI0034D6382D
MNIKPIVDNTYKAIEWKNNFGRDIVDQIIKPALDGIFKGFDKFKFEVREMNNMLLKTRDDLDKFRLIISELGYPPHFHMDVPTMIAIVEAYQENKESVIDKFDTFMCTYFDSEKISNIGLKWEDRECLKSRITILRNVIMAHNLGMYGVSVPAIIAQYEGILADAYKLKCQVDGRITRIMLNNLLNNSSGWIKDYDEDVLKYYNNNLLADFYHGKNISSIISRHAILHGGDFKYDKEDVSLRAILLFDYISERIKDISETDIKSVNTKVNSYIRWKRNKNKAKKK